MKVTAISDLHGYFPIIEPCDVLLICGDISPLQIQKDYYAMTKWFFNEFQRWILNIKCSRVILTPGNHDSWFEKMFTSSKTHLFDKLTILIDDELDIYSDDDKWYKIYATPQCQDFGKWAYMPGNKNLAKYYAKIPENVDILMCHDSSTLGFVGHIMDDPTYTNGRSAGNRWLAEAILAKKPKYVVSGHIHSGDHNLTEIEGIKLANVSLKNEDYNPNYNPLTFIL